VTFESDWSPAFGKAFNDALNGGDASERLDLGCKAAHGHFSFNRDTGAYERGRRWQAGHRLPI
jgi:hypothetical protein